MVEFCLRGQVEASSIIVEDFETGSIDEGCFKGVPYIRLKETYKGQKGKKLTLKKSIKDAENAG